jgi:hypothetical protein
MNKEQAKHWSIKAWLTCSKEVDREIDALHRLIKGKEGDWV